MDSMSKSIRFRNNIYLDSQGIVHNQETLKSIISTALDSPSWCNSQPWNIYVASGNTLSEIRKLWISKNEKGEKGYSDLDPGHRTDFSER